MSNGLKVKPKDQKLKISPKANAKAIAEEVRKRMKSKFLNRFDEFIEDADDKIMKAQEAIADNEFAKRVMFESDQADDTRTKSVIDSFQTAIDMTKNTLIRTTAKKEAAMKLRKIIKKNKVVTPLEVLTLFDIVMGA